jgi:hypothetical protein
MNPPAECRRPHPVVLSIAKDLGGGFRPLRNRQQVNESQME